jgi:hypothetical protein
MNCDWLETAITFARLDHLPSKTMLKILANGVGKIGHDDPGDCIVVKGNNDK